MIKSSQVAVIGGGIVGTACAYFLSLSGAKVKIIERDALGSGASGHGAGAFGVPLHWVEPLWHAAFMRQAVRLLKWTAPQVAEEAKIDILMREMPWLEVARTEPTWNYMKEWAPKTNLTLVSADDIRRLEPRLAEPILGGLVEEGSGQLDAYRLNLAFAKAAEMRGAEVVIAEVIGLEQAGGKVSAVKTTSGDIGADAVVLAMGAWSSKAEEWTGVSLPIEPLKGEILTLRYKEGEYWPYWVASYETTGGEELPIYLHKRGNGLIYAGTTAEPGKFDNTPTEAARNGILQRAVNMMPCIAEAELVEHLAGPRPNPSDGITVLGPVPEWEGLFMAVTLPGILCSAYLGKIIDNLVFGRPVPESIEKLHPKRLTEPSKESYGYRRLLAERSI